MTAMVIPQHDNGVPRLVLDTRLGGCARYVLATPGELMAVAPEMEKCVVFLARLDKDGERLTGTAFLLDEYIGECNARLTYLVTARHVIERIQQTGRGNACLVRLNLKGRGAQSLPMDLSHWIFHDDSRVDLAIAPINWGDADEHLSIPVGMIATPEIVQQVHSLRPGALLYFPGLFYRHAGDSQIIPIMRLGSIAAMPSEPIRLTGRAPIEGYLIEARSIGGLSGSPVFLDFGLHIEQTHLIGVVHGHYGVRDVPDYDAEDTIPFPADKEERSVNMGIGIVTPAYHIVELLHQPQLIDVKRRFAETVRKRREAELPELD